MRGVRDESHEGDRCAEVRTVASSEDDLVLVARNTKFVSSLKEFGMEDCV